MPKHTDIPRLFLVSGVPGAGKSTTARALAATFGRGVHIEGDKLQHMIVTGGSPPKPEFCEDSEAQILLNVRNQCLLAQSFLAAGFAVVLDYVVVHRARLLTYAELLAPHEFGFVVLAPAPAVAAGRDRGRVGKQMFATWQHLSDDMRAQLRDVGSWIDTSSHDVDTVVEMIRGGTSGPAVITEAWSTAERAAPR